MSVAMLRNTIAADAARGWSPARAMLVTAAVGVILVAAVVAQVAVLPWLPLPGGPPDAVLVAVVAFALSSGERPGAVGGFGAGLVLDLVPPADHSVGQWALVLCLVGCLAGLMSREAPESTVVTMATAGLAGFAAPLAFTLCGALAGDPRASWSATAGALPATVLYTIGLTPLAVALFRRVTGDR
jgi:rod shape-determining protein MreD